MKIKTPGITVPLLLVNDATGHSCHCQLHWHLSSDGKTRCHKQLPTAQQLGALTMTMAITDQQLKKLATLFTAAALTAHFSQYRIARTSLQ
jgi:hypothetical protein